MIVAKGRMHPQADDIETSGLPEPTPKASRSRITSSEQLPKIGDALKLSCNSGVLWLKGLRSPLRSAIAEEANGT